jgi:hypothetical protein
MVNFGSPRQSLNKAFLKVNPVGNEVNHFVQNLLALLGNIQESENEEFHKNLISDFLKKSYYDSRYFINTKARYDLVIHTGKDSSSAVGVILELKSPINKTEMPKPEQLNGKALQQLLFYFLQERVTGKNLEIKHLIITNCYEWFVFDAHEFERCFANDKVLLKTFEEFMAGGLTGTRTDFFYQNIAKPAIAQVIDRVKFTHFDLRDLENLDLIDLYKFLAPEHLLKLPFVNDSNSLNKPFYNELLYIIGLTEVKDKGKKLIGRVKEGDRQAGSLIENAISRLESLGKLSRLSKPEEFGDTDEERLFNVALRLSINWINRILFLKLLEAQLIKYYQGDLDSIREFAFLNLEKVKSYNDLDGLFFDILAKEENKREKDVKDTFANIPYLNSSLFELLEIEHETILMGNLKDRALPIFGATVLKDSNGNRRSGNINTLKYLFEFLSAYRFDRDESEDSQEDSEKLINASVLGLIFEKINGYKDGSFYTPSFITMYMCRETIRRAVVQKFNEVKGWNCEKIRDLHGRIEDKMEANAIINSLKICDPAVGSGHFLVSALNEMIAIKSELRVLLDKEGMSLRDYRVEVRNDKLLVYDDEGKLFDYRPNNAERQRVQETLFHEKQTIIEGCLFGVDINPNSVNICRLRLWIELLKHAYYRVDGKLETLPNIDINIKEGNSLISQFGIDVDLKLILFQQKNQSLINEYKNTVKSYFSATVSIEKHNIRNNMKKQKANLKNCLKQTHEESKKLKSLRKKLEDMMQQSTLPVIDPNEVAKDITKLRSEIKKLEQVEKEKTAQKDEIYSNTFEWRFEFPQVLNDDSDFVGFDVVIGNPPYIRQEEIKELKPFLERNYQCYTGVADLFVYFYELGLNLLKPNGHLTYISSNKYFRAGYGEKLRQFLTDSTTIYNLIDFGDYPVFEEAIAYPSIITLSKAKPENNQVQALSWDEAKKQDIAQFATILEQDGLRILQANLKPDGWRLESSQNFDLLTKLRNIGRPLGEHVNGALYYGIKTGLNEAFVIDRATRDRLINEHPSSSKVIKPLLRGRDVKRWCVDYQDLYLIFTRRGINIKNYPAIEKYLSQYRDRLTAGVEGGRKAGSYEWYEIQDNVAYWQEFEKSKIVWGNLATSPQFALAPVNSYVCAPANLIVSENNNYLLAILNSKAAQYVISQNAALRQGGFLEFKPIYVSQVTIPAATESQRTAIEKLVQKCLDAKKGDPKADTNELKQAINALVYQLYGLTEEEIKIVEGER